MLPAFFAVAAFLSTMAGGVFALHHKDRLHRVLGYTAGVLLGVVAFEILPEIFRSLQELHWEPTIPMLAFVAGFLVFHIIEKSILLHHAQEHEYSRHKHPHVGIASALALSGHSLLDGIGIGLGFQVNATVGLAVALAVIAHDFSDGLNTVGLMLLHKNGRKDAFKLLLLDALAPVLGALSTLFVQVSAKGLLIYLGFFAGFLIYIGASEILPEAHSQKSSYGTIALTISGALFMFIVARLT